VTYTSLQVVGVAFSRRCLGKKSMGLSNPISQVSHRAPHRRRGPAKQHRSPPVV